MKLTKQRLIEIIKEELEATELNEFEKRGEEQRKDQEAKFSKLWAKVQKGVEELSNTPGLNMGYLEGIPNSDEIAGVVADALAAIRKLDNPEQEYMAAFQVLMNQKNHTSNLDKMSKAAEENPEGFTSGT
jgi:hypothetical protein